ncbi:MAG: ribosome recycling factor [Chloroflexi bacterium]|nr:ribosome recycling factor [Chloroflexota bacterium]
MADHEDIDLILLDAEDRMDKSVEVFRRECDALRTGRANPGLLEDLKIELYGTTMPLKQLATISAPDARLLVVQPFDRSAVGAIEKEILKSDLGLTPQSDGLVIRLPIPPMTRDRRQEMVKRLKRLQEDAHVSIRNVRRDALEQVRALEKGKEISQDDLHRAQDALQKVTDASVAKADEASVRKEADLMEV